MADTRAKIHIINRCDMGQRLIFCIDVEVGRYAGGIGREYYLHYKPEVEE